MTAPPHKSVRRARFGDLMLERTSGDVFELIRLSGGETGAAMARIGVEQREYPELTVSLLDQSARTIKAKPRQSSGRVVLADCREGAPHCFHLTAEPEGDHLTLILSADSRIASRDHRLRLFWWRAEFSLNNDQLIVRGPHLRDDPSS